MKRADLLKGIDRWRFVPAGVADPAKKRLFVSDNAGGIVALNPTTGEPVWRSREAAIPLLGLNGALLAAASDRVPRLLDAESGETVDSSLADPLPIARNLEWWPVAVWRDGQAVVFAWKSSWAEGVASIDIDGGRVADAAGATEPGVPPERAGVTADLQLFRAADGSAEPWRAGDRVAALVIDQSKGKERLRLMTWSVESGESLKSVELQPSIPRLGHLEHHRSPDVDFIFLLSSNDTEQDGAPIGTICNWLVFRVTDGRKVTEFPHPAGLHPPLAVIGNRLLYIEVGGSDSKKEMPLRRLCAIDTASAQLAWACDIARMPGRMR